jgi:RHS repeat-associated protein
VKNLRLFIFFVLTTLLIYPANGQVATGIPPFSSIGGGSSDAINLGNLNVHVGVPILSKAGRGLPLTYAMSYDSSVWYPSGGVWTPVQNWGWRGITEAAVGYVTYNVQLKYTFCGQPPTRTLDNYYSNWVYHDTNGVAHYFPIFFWEDCDSGMGSGSATATDGSGYTMNASGSGGGGSATLFNPSGRVIAPPMQAPTGSGTVTDANGNRFTVTVAGSTTTVYDTLSSTAAALTVTGLPTPTQITYPGPNTSTSTTTLNYTPYNIKTNFNCSGVSEYTSTGTVNLLTKITLPDGSIYQFGYEDTLQNSGYKTGRISSLTLPTGATISYSYTNGDGTHNPIVCSDGSTPGLNRVTPDSTNPWQYVRNLVSGTNWKTSVTTPNSDVTNINFQYSAPNYYETKRVVNSGASTVLQTSQTCYGGTAPDCTGTTITSLGQRDVYVELPDGTGKTSKTSSFYDSYGHVTEVDSYDFGSVGSGTPGGLLRKVLTSYTTLPTNSLGTTIVVPYQNTLQDGSGSTKAQTTFTYDQGTPATTTGTPQHASVTGSRGNVTQIASLVQGTTTLSKSFTYYDTGGVNTSTDVNGAVTTLTLSNSTASCGNSFATNVAEPLSLTRSMTWNCTRAVQTGVTDENGNSTSVTFYDATKTPTFDPLWRPIYSTDAAGNQTTYAYSTTTAESKLLFNSSNSVVDNLATVDSLGRTHVSQRRQGPTSSNYDSVENDYDTLGRPYKTTMPYAATAGQTASSPKVTTTTYDAANRIAQVQDAGGGYVTYDYTTSSSLNDVLVTGGPKAGVENLKQRQFEYDGAGRLTSVCELSSTLSGNGSCGQSHTQTGFWTKYTYDTLGDLLTVAQNAQSGTSQNRTYVYDGLGRMTSETNPETGTTVYVYDSDSGGTCAGPYNGDLVKRTDAVGNVTCYAYDSLHRVKDITYPSGSYASVTAAKHFVYDSATVNGVAMANAKGHLAEAYTGASKTTDLGFSYSVRGENTDVYESTPHSGGYYHVTGAYWPHGPLKSLSGLPSMPTLYYGASDGSGLDGEGRFTKVNASAGQNPITGITYTSSGTAQPIGSLTQATLGSADYDTFSYDVNTGRMSQYQFNIGSPLKSDTGGLTWNANGTLQQLAITDQLNTANTQTCNYGYDDLVRIASANCGTAWSQTFSFDPFGNITKNGSISWACATCYDTTKNRYNSTLSPSINYDNNGNLTNDTFHTYTWDAEGKSLSVDTVSLTYDALGRMVEQNRSGTYTEIAYAPGGSKLALMTGQILQKAFAPLPGGGTAVYNSSGLAYYRHTDWLGSSRVASTPSRTLYFDGAYAPYGESYAASGTTDLDFTGQNQDTVSGLSDFLHREYHANQSRWISPDPAGLGAAAPVNPQTWNRYGYVANNPLVAVDPTGLMMDLVSPFDGGGDDSFGGDCLSCDGGLDPMFGPGEIAVDGIPMNAAQAGLLLKIGAAVQCPNNTCQGITNDGRFTQFHAFAGDGGGYYPVLGPGSIEYSYQQAGMAAIRNINQTSIDQNTEYAGELYQDANGIYSYDTPRPGSVSGSFVDPTAVPSGTNFIADYHTHGANSNGVYDDEHFSTGPQSDVSGITALFGRYPNYVGGFLGTPGGRTEFYNPANGTCTVLAGPPLAGCP